VRLVISGLKLPFVSSSRLLFDQSFDIFLNQSIELFSDFPMHQDKDQSARQKLVQAALVTFAEKGYEGASTREIADKAGANISSIRYYFGDKAGLYRAAYTEPLCGTPFEQGIPDLNRCGQSPETIVPRLSGALEARGNFSLGHEIAFPRND
jgi:hypothetical protein